MLDISIATILKSSASYGSRIGVFLKDEQTRIQFHEEVSRYFEGVSGMVVRRNKETLYLKNESIVHSFGGIRENDIIKGYRFQTIIVGEGAAVLRNWNEIFTPMLSVASNYSLIQDLQQKYNKKIPASFRKDTEIIFIEEGDFEPLETK